MDETKNNENEDKFIKLIKKEPSTQRINTRKKEQKEVQNELRKNSKEYLDLNLEKWKFLAHGGAFWIFYIPKQNLSLSSSSNEVTQKYQKNGEYVLRIRQIKWIKQLIDIRIDIILQSLIKDNEQIKVKAKEALSENTFNQVKNQQDSFTKLKSLEDQLVNEQKRLIEFEIKGTDRLTILLRKIYDQFLTNTLENPLRQTIQENDFHHNLDRSQLLPKIAKAIVRQSQSFEIDNFNQQDIDCFVQFLFKELIIQKFQSRIKKQKLKPLTNDQIEQKVNENLKTYPINYELLRPLFVKQQVLITFQRNLLNFININQLQQTLKHQANSLKAQYIKEDNRKVQQQSIQENNQVQVHIGQVFELKPKTILPDIYSNQFIDIFVQRYKNNQCIKQLVKINQKRDNLLLRQMQSLINIQQNIKQAIIQVIESSIFDKSYTTTNNLLSIQSTRWFKKNCLQTGKKKKNQNPFIYFVNCFRKNMNFDTQNINYYDKKHIRKVQVLKIVDNKDKVQDKQVQITENDNKNYDKMEQKDVNLLNKHLLLLHDEIINHIHLKQQLVECNQHKSLSLIEEILALQLIDLVDVDTFLKYDHRQNNQTHLINGHNYIDILKVQNISHALKQLAYKNNIERNSLSNLHINLKQQPSKLIFPSMSLHSINNSFHPQVYMKSLKLAQQLKYIIFQSPQINQVIQKTFNLAQIEIDTIKLEIKTGLFYLMRYLISLTWKDISLLIQQQLTLTVNNNNQNIQSLIIYQEIQKISNGFPHLNQIETQKQQLIFLISKSTQIQRKVLNCNIIDYNLKTLLNIDKNVEKDHQFLLNSLKYRLKNNNKI